MSRDRGPEAFDAFYQAIYGERWHALKEAMTSASSYASLQYEDCAAYYLDPGSIRIARALDVKPGMRVVDLCAAPGGKSLVIAGDLGGEGDLVSNDRSRKRRERLKSNIDTHLPAGLRETVSVTGHDARKWCLYETDAYDAVLLDAPCSADKHMLETPAELAQWSPSRTRRLATESYTMLASALDIVRVGGAIVYSTCTISPAENDEVIRRLYAKRKGRFEIEVVASDGVGEATEFGRIVLPDVADGSGPLYFARLKRIR